MIDSTTFNKSSLWKPIVISLAILFIFSAVLPKLVQDWWSDENYSHGLLIPFVVAYIVWTEWDRLRAARSAPYHRTGLVAVLLSLGLLMVAVLGSELFVQRLSLVFMLVGVTLYFFGAQVLRLLFVPFLLLLLSIPIPQILFNKIALPLQMLASKIAGYFLIALGIAPTRRGNVIEIIPRGTDLVVGLEVVEACSGIRSLMTLAAVAVILVYLTRERDPARGNNFLSFIKDTNFIRGLILVLSAAPIALLTNALRVTGTGILTYFWGFEAATGTGHDTLGWVTFLAGLVVLIFENEILRRLLSRWNAPDFPVNGESYARLTRAATSTSSVAVLLIVLLFGGLFINWFDRREERQIPRTELAQLPREVGQWRMSGVDIKFNIGTEDILRATDYVMRNYRTDDGDSANLYVGYYDSQRTGATYHSPQNCLPGSGWQMKNGKTVMLTTPSGKSLEVKRYRVENGDHREVMVYWYQGRGRSTSNEYIDKLYKIQDSVFMQRSDGAMVRVMTGMIDGDEEKANVRALDFAAHVADSLGPFVPE